jgi:hypothetical protein
VIATFVRGFDQAHARLRDAIAKAETPAEQAFIPLFEALHWAVALDARATKSPGVSIAAEKDDLQALRFARNRAGHQWVSAVELRDITSPPAPIIGGRSRRGATVRMTRPASIWAWVWIDEAQLPPPDDPKHDHLDQKAAYESCLQGKPAYEVLERLSVALTALR